VGNVSNCVDAAKSVILTVTALTHNTFRVVDDVMVGCTGSRKYIQTFCKATTWTSLTARETKFEMDFLKLHLNTLRGFSWFRTGIKDGLCVRGNKYSLRDLVGLSQS
jgi:hypothetical protein